MIRSLILVAAILVCAAASIPADVGIPALPARSSGSLASPSDDPLGLGKTAEFRGLFDSKRLSFQHTVGMSFSSGGNGGGFTQYYLNTITYKAAKPLTVHAQVGIQHNVYGKALYGSSSSGSARIVVPYVGLLYEPSPKFRIEIQFSNTPYYYGFRRGYPY